MAHWNHFGNLKYELVLFKGLKIGDRLRKDFFKGKRRRSNIICIKTGELEYTEQKSGKVHKLHFLPENYQVCSFDALALPLK